MGISPSRRVSGSLQNSGEFNSACKSVFDQLSSLNHHHSTDAVVLPYQLLDASNHLHLSLSASNPLVKKWVPDPPPRDQVDRVYRSISTRRQPKDADNNDGSPASLRLEQFKSFAVELFASAVVGNAARAVATRVPIGAVGIVGVGVATRSDRGLNLRSSFVGGLWTRVRANNVFKPTGSVYDANDPKKRRGDYSRNTIQSYGECFTGISEDKIPILIDQQHTKKRRGDYSRNTIQS